LAEIKEIAMEKHALKNVNNCWNTNGLTVQVFPIYAVSMKPSHSGAG